MAYNNNSKKPYQHNTNGVQMYTTATTLEYSFWNKFITFKISPALENPTENERFDYDRTLMCSLSPLKAGLLMKHLNQIVTENMIETDTRYSFGLPVGAANSIFIGVEPSTDDTPAYAFIRINKNHDPETMKPESTLEFKFGSERTLSEDSDGNISVTDESQAQLEFLNALLIDNVPQLSGINAHMIAYVDNRYRGQIAEAVGAKSGGGSGSNQYTGSVFGGGQQQGSQNKPAQRDSMSNFDQINNFSDMG